MSFACAGRLRKTRRLKNDFSDTAAIIGTHASNDQRGKILSYFDIGLKEGANILTGGKEAEMGGDLAGGYYIELTIFKGHNKMRIFQEDNFGPDEAVRTRRKAYSSVCVRRYEYLV